MSCGPTAGKFRLLDFWVGWSEASAPVNLCGLDDEDGLHLCAEDSDTVGAAVWDYLLPPRLARGCGHCDWYLLTPGPSRLLRRGACSPAWQPLWTPACDAARMVRPVAIAAHQHQLAVADPGAGVILVWNRDGAVLQAEIAFPDATAVGFTVCGDLLAAGGGQLQRFDRSGNRLGAALALPGEAIVVAGDPAGGVWMLTRDAGGALALWHMARGSGTLLAASLAQLAAAGFGHTGVEAVGTLGFCLHQQDRGGIPTINCWDWFGRPLAHDAIGAVPPPGLHRSGSIDTLALDSGMPRCRWHRVQLDADIPAGTSLKVMVASSDHAATTPHADDWQAITTGAADFLIDQAPGRFLYLRIEFTGDGQATPLVRRVRLDFPRSTSLDSLPPVFRENPRAEDFTERFLTLFDAGVAQIDAALDQFPAAFDVDSTRSEMLPWLASFLDLVFDPSWERSRQRTIVAALPRLYRMRGTVEGLRLAIRLVFDSEVAIQELAFERAWGHLGGIGAPLGTVRLFGKSRARFALGRSGLGSAPVNSFGNPDLDPIASGAYRFRVLVPPGPMVSPLTLQRLGRLVESQKPAHTQAVLRSGGGGFVLGSFSAIGIDSVLGPLPAPVLGAQGSVRLGRMSVLWPARRGGQSVFVLGNPLVAGVQTILE
jgi:phage tail-like protein